MRIHNLYVDDKGRDIALKPGATWVMLQPNTRTTVVR